MPTTQLPLKDIHLPETIGWWPPAIGWWLIAIFIPLIIVFLYWLYKRLTRKSAIKTAIKSLAIIKQYSNLENDKKLRELSILIRRVAISVSPRAEAASLTGHQWLAFLDKSLAGAPFSSGCGQLLNIGCTSIKNETQIQSIHFTWYGIYSSFFFHVYNGLCICKKGKEQCGK